MSQAKDTKLTIRADKLLSSLGLESRRNIDKFLKRNNVVANGKRIEKPGVRILPSSEIVVNGRKIHRQEFIYIILNKPKGYISTVSDEFGRKNVLSLVNTKERVFPVGRLDKDTHGLIILTNDGELTNLLIHPRYHIPKVYSLTIKGEISKEKIEKFKTGVMLEDGLTKPAKTSIEFKDQNKTTLLVTLFEGRKRQIRRMCKALNLDLLDLERIEFGPIKLGKLKLGESRNLTNIEIKKLKAKP